jgi:hypothetical protein
MQVIAIAGLAKCGKTTLADEIARIAYEKGMVPRRMSFAGSLKRAAEDIGASKALQPDLYRKFCQEVGKNMRDPTYCPGVTGPNWWVDRTREELNLIAATEGYTKSQGGEVVVIFDDVRFPNELNMLRAMGAVRLYVDREQELPDPTGEWRNHDSEKMAYDMRLNAEQRLANFNFHVISSGPLEDYLIRVRPFIPVWLGLENVYVPGSK